MSNSTKSSSFSIYKRMMVFLKPYLALFILAAILATLVSLVDSASIWFLSTLPKILFTPDSFEMVRPEMNWNNVNEILKYYSYQFIASGGNPLAKISIFILLAFIVKNITLYISKAITHHVNLSISRDMRSDVYRHVMDLPISYYDQNETGKIVSYVVNELNQINVTITETVQKFTMEPIKIIINISLLLMINAKLTLLVFLVYPVLAFVIVKIGKSVKRRIKRELDSFSRMISTLTESIGGIRAIKMFNMHNLEYERFQEQNKTHKRNTFKSQLTRELLSPITEVLGITVTVGVLWFAGSDILDGTSSFSADDFVRFIFFLIASYAPMKSLGGVNNTVQAGITAARRVFGLLDEKKEELHPVGSKKDISFKNSIEFKDVTFNYPGYDKIVLDKLSFSAKKGSSVAIIGSSGAGKSTILDLLPRFYEISSGTISIDGASTSEMDLVSLRSLFGIVSQETILFNMSIKENISYGVSSSESELLTAVKSANALEFIEQLPQGFDTIIGERGVTLSGGQRQRIAIARALLRNPEILIFDEATSALDTESEKLVQEAIDHLTQDRTAFIVAHRLSTVLHADKIVVIENGSVVEEGTHDDLIALGNRYKYFYDIQFKKEIKNG